MGQVRVEPCQERLSPQCEAQMIVPEMTPGLCVTCDLGAHFKCARHLWQEAAVHRAKVGAALRA